MDAPRVARVPSTNMSVIAKKWVLAKPFVGKPVASDFSLEEEQLPEPKDGGNITFR